MAVGPKKSSNRSESLVSASGICRRLQDLRGSLIQDGFDLFMKILRVRADLGRALLIGEIGVEREEPQNHDCRDGAGNEAF